MFVSDVCHLTTREYTILENMKEQPFARDDLMRSIISRKLSNAIVMLQDQIPDTVATLGSRVTYETGKKPAETRVLVNDDFHGLMGLLAVLPISHPYGLAMLGLTEGARVILRPLDGPMEEITVFEVVHRPEAAPQPALRRRRLMGSTQRQMPQVPAWRANVNACQSRPLNPQIFS